MFSIEPKSDMFSTVFKNDYTVMIMVDSFALPKQSVIDIEIMDPNAATVPLWYDEVEYHLNRTPELVSDILHIVSHAESIENNGRASLIEELRCCLMDHVTKKKLI